MNTSERPRVIICQGPPRCDADAVLNPKPMPCPWCRIEEVQADGTITVIQEPAST